MCRSAIIVCALVASVSQAVADLPASLTIFGDSLSDTGNIDDLTFGFVPGGAYFDGRFSNGPIWAETMSAELGLGPVEFSRDGGRNYAHGGAETGAGSEFVFPIFIPRLGTQINTYLNGGNTPAAGELFVVWGGANNFINDPETNPDGPASDIANHITALAGAGATQFLVPNLPRLGQTPRYRGTADEATYDTLSLQFNSTLAPQLVSLESSLGVSIQPLDIGLMFDQLLAEPAAFGLTNVTDQAIAGVPNPDEYVYWDDLHPTRVVHETLGLAAVDTVAETVDHAWSANAPTGRFGVVANWGPVGLPAAHWKATLNNDLSGTERTAEVTIDQTVDTILVSGTTGEMRLQIEAGVILSVANGLTVEAGGIVDGDGTIEGDVTIGSGGILSPGLMDVDAADLNIFAPALLGNALLRLGSSANLSRGVENVPEPGTLALLTSGLIGLALLDCCRRPRPDVAGHNRRATS